MVCVALSLGAMLASPGASAYLADTTIPEAGGCPALDRQNISLAQPLNRRWSTALPSTTPAAMLTVAASGSAAQLTEIEQAIDDSFGAWSGVTGTTFNAVNYPGVIVPITRVTSASACTNDQESNIDGLNTICFDQSSTGFTTGVLAFTRVITANAAGVSVGSSAPAAFAGQILDADTLFRSDGQATFATPGALATPQGAGAYDLESLLIHELGEWFGLDQSAVWSAVMFPFPAPPGQFLGSRPTVSAPDAPLSDDDRAGIRYLYPDPSDTVNVGSIRGQVLPANRFKLANLPAALAASGSFVTGIFGAHVVAVDTASGAVIASAVSGWSCNEATGAVQFDGSFDIERLPVGRSYTVYAEPLIGAVAPSDFSEALGDLCSSGACTTPAVDTDFNPRVLPSQ
jgi:hypothetical protein